MNFFALSAFINLLLSLLIGIFVLLRNARSSINRNFSYFCFSVAFWSFGYVFWQLSNDEEVAYFWTRFLMVGAAGAPLFYFTLVLDFLGLQEKPFYRKQKFFAYTLFIFLTLVNITTPWLVKSVEPRLIFSFWPIGGPVFYPFILSFFAYVIYASALLGREYRKSSGIKKIQTKYVFVGIVLAFIGGSTNYFLWFNIPIPPLLNILVSGYPIAIGYAIIRYRLMDVRLVLSKSILYFILTGFVTGIFVLSGLLSSDIFEGNKKYALIANIIIAFIIVLTLPLLQKGIALVTEKIFFKKEVDYGAVLQKLTNILSVEINLTKLIEALSNELADDLKLKHAFLFLATKDNFFIDIEETSVKHKHHKNLNEKNNLFKYLRTNPEIIIKEELERMVGDAKTTKEKFSLEGVVTEMNTFEAAAAVPVAVTKTMNALLILGEKRSGDSFSQRDIDLFQVISPQIGSAIEKAKLYQESQQFNEKLKLEVQRATGKLREANKYLKDLDKAKSEFMSIASHQLRTPLTGIRGYLSMLDEGDYGPIEPKKAGIIKQVLDASTRLTRLVDIFLNVSRIENNRFILNLEPTQMEDIIDKEVFELSIPAKNKGLELIWKRPKKKLPIVNVDRDKIKDVVLNLIDNAIKYTEKGSIMVSAESEENGTVVHVKVKDTGVGIDPEDAKKLFNKFVRGSGIARIQPDGSGLGLFIGKKITEAHGGQIWVESEGLGHGTTFQFILPAGRKAITEAKTLQAG